MLLSSFNCLVCQLSITIGNDRMPKISDKCKNTNFYLPLIKQYRSAQLARVGRQVEGKTGLRPITVKQPLMKYVFLIFDRILLRMMLYNVKCYIIY